MCTGKRMKQRRKELGIKAEEVAEVLGCSRSTVFRYENGDIEKVPATLINTIAEVLKTTPAYLMGWSDDTAPLASNITPISKPVLPADAIPYEPIPMVLVPLVGVVNCGTPLFAEDNIEEQIPTPAVEVLTGETYFWLKAKGDSMINIGIHDGDLLFIRQQSDVDSGDIAVVAINGDDATLKRVIKKENSLVLQPENPSHETKIYVGSEVDNICIRGRLMKVEKRF